MLSGAMSENVRVSDTKRKCLKLLNSRSAIFQCPKMSDAKTACPERSIGHLPCFDCFQGVIDQIGHRTFHDIRDIHDAAVLHVERANRRAACLSQRVCIQRRTVRSFMSLPPADSTATTCAVVACGLPADACASSKASR